MLRTQAAPRICGLGRILRPGLSAALHFFLFIICISLWLKIKKKNERRNPS